MNWADVFSINLYHGYIPQILIAEALFALKLRRRPHFGLRLAVSLPVCLVLSVALPNVIAMIVSGFFSLTIFLLSLGLCRVLFEGRFTDILFCCVSAQFTQNLAYNVENLFYLPFADKISNVGWFCLSLGTMLVIYSTCYLIFAQRMDEHEEIHVSGGYMFPIAIVNALFVYTMQYLFQVYGIDKLWVSRPPLIVCCIFGLCIQFGLLAYKSEKEENAKLEYFLRQEEKQYEVAKNNIDLLNMKAHDLKHYINRVQAVSGSVEELQEIADVVKEYEKTVSCGNQTLDVLLTEKQYQCWQDSIDLSLMVQGEELAFFHTADLVSIFGNALENAIECELRVPEEGKRCISLKVFRKGNILCIHMENFCNERIRVVDGLPVTNKKDKGGHGFGLKSIRYAVQKYGGTMQIGSRENAFVLNIVVPLPGKP